MLHQPSVQIPFVCSKQNSCPHFLAAQGSTRIPPSLLAFSFVSRWHRRVGLEGLELTQPVPYPTFGPSLARFPESRAAAEPRAVQGRRTTAPPPGCPRQGWWGTMMLGDAMERWARRMPAKDARNEGPAPRVCTGWLSPMGGERGAHTHTRLSETTRLKGLKLATSLSPQRLKRSLHISCCVVSMLLRWGSIRSCDGNATCRGCQQKLMGFVHV